MKKISLILLALFMCVSLCSCSQSGNGDGNGEVSVFYYTYSDTYMSGVRSAMDRFFKEAGIPFQNYDANGSQTTQTEQITTAIAKNTVLLAVNVVDTGSDDAAQHIIEMARAKDIPVVFFNRSVEQNVVESYDKCVFVGTDYQMAGSMQGDLVGEYILANYEKTDLNGDGEISYVMFKGQEGNLEAISRTLYGVQNADKVLTAAGKPALKFYDSSNANKYLVDQNGQWSSAAATDYMSTILAQYSEANGNMVELVIANNDEMALGAISALQAAGYNKSGGTVIPVFGVDAIDAARDAIRDGNMTGTIKQDGEGMAQAIVTVSKNLMTDNERFADIPADEVVGNWRINIPYQTYKG